MAHVNGQLYANVYGYCLFRRTRRSMFSCWFRLMASVRYRPMVRTMTRARLLAMYVVMVILGSRVTVWSCYAVCLQGTESAAGGRS